MNYFKSAVGSVTMFSDLQVKQGLAYGSTKLTDAEVAEHEGGTLTIEQQAVAGAATAQAYLDATDWLASKYTDVVCLGAEMTADEFKEKYAEIYDERITARAVVSAYNDEYL